MDLNIKTVEQVTVAEITGEVNNQSAPEIQGQILPLIRSGSKVLLDMSQVNFMSSAGLRMLLSMYRRASNYQGQIALVGLSEEIQDTMSVTGFLDFFTTYETVEAGLSAWRQNEDAWSE